LLLRGKGVLHLAEEPERRTIYQRVGERWTYSSAEPWGDETPRSSLVFIGPRGLLNRPALEASLNACVAENQLE
jgi:G3E family GTPase